MLSPYVGRFAPSPSGPLHMGSLVCALASYLDAKKNSGTWFIRIEDIDENRCKSEYTQDILETLASYTLTSETEVVIQSHRHPLYQKTLDSLSQKNITFACNCTRKQLHNTLHNSICQGLTTLPHSIRFNMENEELSFVDKIQGKKYINLLNDIGHPILKRKGNNFSYLLAVVADDYDQGVTHVIRGMDLLGTTPSQIHLFKKLGWQPPEYGHIPLVMDQEERKLSKQNHAPAIPKGDTQTLKAALAYLKIETDDSTNIKSTLDQAIDKWNINLL